MTATSSATTNGNGNQDSTPAPEPHQQQLSYEQSLEYRKRLIAPSYTLFFQNSLAKPITANGCSVTKGAEQREGPLKIVRGSKQYLYDDQGQAYLDCVNNVAHVGHCHPTVVAAECGQAAVLNTNTRFLNDQMLLCAEKLTSLLPDPLKVCFFVNSGSEANDLALTLAHYHTGGNTDVITLDHAYHGHLTSIVAISPYKFNKRTGYKKPDWVHVAPSPDTYRGKYQRDEGAHSKGESEPNFGKLYADEVANIVGELAAKGRQPSAFIAESMQSCAGQILPPPNYLRNVYQVVRDAGGVCIADEVQVGFGRMGDAYWAFQLQGEDVIPDIVTLGKPIGNGHPVSAVVTTRAIAESFYRAGGGYFNTFGGNPVSCAVALAVMNVIEKESLVENARIVGKHLICRLNELQKYQAVGDVRGHGLFVGFELVKSRTSKEPDARLANQVQNRLKRDFRIIVSTDGPYDNIIKMKPPMVFTKENADLVVDSLHIILTDVEGVKKSNEGNGCCCGGR